MQHRFWIFKMVNKANKTSHFYLISEFLIYLLESNNVLSRPSKSLLLQVHSRWTKNPFASFVKLTLKALLGTTQIFRN